MDNALLSIGELLDEIATRRRGTPEEICDEFVLALKLHSPSELQQYAKNFDQLGSSALAEMCRGMAADKARQLH